MGKQMISVLIPCHNESTTISYLIFSIQEVFRSNELTWEIIIIDDGSKDATALLVKELQDSMSQLHLIALSENIGQYESIKLGVPKCSGEWIVVMDADGQDDATMIPQLYQKASTHDFDAVFGERKKKKYPLLKILTSKLFHGVLAVLTLTKQNHRIAGFGIYKKSALMELASYGSPFLYLPLMRQWKSYKTSTLPVTHQTRISGQSSYSFLKQLFLANKILRSLYIS